MTDLNGLPRDELIEEIKLLREARTPWGAFKSGLAVGATIVIVIVLGLHWMS